MSNDNPATPGSSLSSIVILSAARSAESKDPRIFSEAAHKALGERIGLLAIALTLTFAASTAHAQGCAQCLDSTRATPPTVQAAYRHAIYLLGGVGAAAFIAGAVLLRRNP